MGNTIAGDDPGPAANKRVNHLGRRTFTQGSRMPRGPRIIIPGLPHHVTQRGNRKQVVFFDDKDRRHFLKLLLKYSRRSHVEIGSYCLIPNHYHLITRPPSKKAHSQLMHALDGHYAGYFNQKYQRTGHLWQGRYLACPTDPAHFANTLRYVAQNPVRAGLVDDPADYPWSSTAALCGLRDDPILAEDFPSRNFVQDWGRWFGQPLADEVLERIRTATHRGVPYASKEFIQGLEELLGVSLLPKRGSRRP